MSPSSARALARFTRRSPRRSSLASRRASPIADRSTSEPVLPTMPSVSQETFRVRSHARTLAEAHQIARGLTLEGVAQQIKCPMLVVYGAGDKLIPVAEGERLARAASGPTDFVVFEEGNHVCFNISYKFRPLTADWTAEHLNATAH